MRDKLIVTIIASIIFLQATPAANLVGKYTDWGVDEYEFFGLSQDAVKKKFAGQLCFHEGFLRVHFKHRGYTGYYGPTFRLHFDGGKVVSVQGVFEGCQDTIYRPEFTTKKDALKFAIAGLSDATDEASKKKLAAARNELTTVKASSNNR